MGWMDAELDECGKQGERQQLPKLWVMIPLCVSFVGWMIGFYWILKAAGFFNG